MDPGWLLIFVFLIVESVVVGILVMPMGTNMIRGAVVMSLNKLWNTNSAMRYISYIIVFINMIYFAMTYKKVYYSPPQEMLKECDRKIELFREQRNLYITGFSIFLFFVFRRVLDIQRKLHNARQIVKGKKK
eukprot:791980_1